MDEYSQNEYILTSLTYPIPVVGIYILLSDKKDNIFMRFHAIQSLLFALFVIIMSILFIVVAFINVLIPMIGFGLAIYYGYLVYNHATVKIPYISDFVSKKTGYIDGLSIQEPEMGNVNTSRNEEDSWSIPPRSDEEASTRSQGSYYEPSPESIEHFDRALEMWNNADESRQNDDLRRDVMAELALAIKKSSAPFPRANALLAMFYNDLKDDKNAKKFAEIALSQDSNEYRAQLVMLDVVLEGVRISNINVGNVVEAKGNWEEMFVGTTFNIIGAAIGKGLAGASQGKFKHEVEKLVRIYRNLWVTNTDVGEYLFMSSTLIALGDFLKDFPMPGGKLNLYAEVVNAPISKLEMDGHEDDVKAIRRKAEGRSLLFENQ